MKGRNTDLPSPPGYSLSVNQSLEVNKANDASLVIKRAWDLALSPLKQVSLNGALAHRTSGLQKFVLCKERYGIGMDYVGVELIISA